MQRLTKKYIFSIYRLFASLHLEERLAGLSIHVAAVNGHLDVAKYLQDHADRAVSEDDKKKERQGKEGTLHRLSSYGFAKLAQHVSNETMLQAAKNGHLEVVKWLYSGFGTDRRINLFDEVSHRENEAFAMVLAMDAAAMNGHLDIVQYLHEMSPAHDADISREQKRRKTNLDNMNVFIGGKRMQHARIKCTTEAMDGAAANNHLEMVKWLSANRDEGCAPLAMVTAAARGHIEMMQWLHDNYDIFTTGALDAAAMNGRLDSLKWLQQHTQCEVGSSDTMDIAASGGHLEVVQWLHQHTSAGCTTEAMDGAAKGGHLEVVKWLNQNRSEAMLQAAASGHWHVMKWLHEHLPDDCTSPAIDQAAIACHFEGVLFLNRTRKEMVSEEVAHYASASTCPGLQDWVSKSLDDFDNFEDER